MEKNCWDSAPHTQLEAWPKREKCPVMWTWEGYCQEGYSGCGPGTLSGRIQTASVLFVCRFVCFTFCTPCYLLQKIMGFIMTFSLYYCVSILIPSFFLCLLAPSFQIVTHLLSLYVCVLIWESMRYFCLSFSLLSCFPHTFLLLLSYYNHT